MCLQVELECQCGLEEYRKEPQQGAEGVSGHVEERLPPDAVMKEGVDVPRPGVDLQR